MNAATSHSHVKTDYQPVHHKRVVSSVKYENIESKTVKANEKVSKVEPKKSDYSFVGIAG